MNRRDFILNFSLLGGAALIGGLGTFWHLLRRTVASPGEPVLMAVSRISPRPHSRPSITYIPAPATAIVYHPDYLRYAGPPRGTYWERPQRLEALAAALQHHPRLRNLPIYRPHPATFRQIVQVHAPWYARFIERWAYLSARDRALLEHPVRPGDEDMATVIPWQSMTGRKIPHTHPYYAAALAAGGGIAAADLIMRGHVDNAFALIRPPGHHARYGRYGGFCIFNNAAITARYLQYFYGLRRILILDWDAHHGNGTQEAFYADPNVLYISLHQMGIFPHTGHIEEVGAGAGRGYTINIPLPAGTGDHGYLQFFESLINPVVRSFQPEFILISAGQDSHHGERIARLRVTTAGYMAFTRYAMAWARDHAQGRLLALLEGGYQLEGLVPATLAIIGTMAGMPPLPEPAVPEYRGAYLQAQAERIYRVQKSFWPQIGTALAASPDQRSEPIGGLTGPLGKSRLEGVHVH